MLVTVEILYHVLYVLDIDSEPRDLSVLCLLLRVITPLWV